ncbi:uncharacterized protein LOC131180654 [Hevea brasiliensis]|uniref:uncharacterized protein LOC131180654 n=1 Tax=Hevea brasiliensis TaxID=3981 RepID=UPI0025EB7BB9|nr:uncharacterized protein LOC131180654 [Hevea brasiliensis]
MPSPKMERDVLHFLGKLNYILRFISNRIAKAEPIFKLLRRIIPPTGIKLVKKLLKELSMGDDAEGPNDVWEMYFDEAVNLAGNGIRAVLVAPDEKHFPITIKLRFGCTNNVAEYEACVSGLQAAIEMKIKKLEVYEDSTLIIYQVKGEWQTKDPKLVPYQKYLLELIKEFEKISFTHLSGDENQFVDALATLVAMTQMEEGKLYNLISPWPFAMWGIDVIDLINPKASNGHRFILVAINYFTKWVEATSCAHITQNTFMKFLNNNVICRYGLPGEIVTDNAKNLNGLKIQKLCDQYKIRHLNSSPYRPQMNGAVELMLYVG